jgi:hypothetical protein
MTQASPAGDQRSNAPGILARKRQFDIRHPRQALVDWGQDRLRHRCPQLDEHVTDASEAPDTMIERVDDTGKASNHRVT